MTLNTQNSSPETREPLDYGLTQEEGTFADEFVDQGNGNYYQAMLALGKEPVKQAVVTQEESIHRPARNHSRRHLRVVDRRKLSPAEKRIADRNPGDYPPYKTFPED